MCSFYVIYNSTVGQDDVFKAFVHVTHSATIKLFSDTISSKSDALIRYQMYIIFSLQEWTFNWS